MTPPTGTGSSLSTTSRNSGATMWRRGRNTSGSGRSPDSLQVPTNRPLRPRVRPLKPAQSPVHPVRYGGIVVQQSRNGPQPTPSPPPPRVAAAMSAPQLSVAHTDCQPSNPDVGHAGSGHSRGQPANSPASILLTSPCHPLITPECSVCVHAYSQVPLRPLRSRQRPAVFHERRPFAASTAVPPRDIPAATSFVAHRIRQREIPPVSACPGHITSGLTPA